MNIYTVCLFGHRRIEDLRTIEERLAPLVKELMRKKEYVVFMIGRNGDFDEYAASVIKRAQNDLGHENSELTLVIPYTVANIEYYEKYYDNVVIPENLHSAYPKSAITLRNHYMIDNSELVISYVEKKGGAYDALKYAEKQGKRIIVLNNRSESLN